MTDRDLGAQRSTLRMSGDCVLRWAELASGVFEGDHLAALVLNTVLRLNVRHLFDDPALNLRYGGLEPPPDDLRRPVTITETARALAMPRVTVGRYVKRLVESGSFVDYGRAGVIMPTREMVSDRTLAMTDPHYNNLVQMLRRLRARAPAPVEEAAPTALRNRSERYRLVLRTAGEFISDWMDPWNRHYRAGYLYGLILAVIMQANDRSADDAAGELSDAAKDPITAHATAISLGLSPETVRRHVHRLEADGLLHRGPAGLIVPCSAWDTPTGRDVLANATEAVARCERVMAFYKVDLSA